MKSPQQQAMHILTITVPNDDHPIKNTLQPNQHAPKEFLSISRPISVSRPPSPIRSASGSRASSGKQGASPSSPATILTPGAMATAEDVDRIFATVTSTQRYTTTVPGALPRPANAAINIFKSKAASKEKNAQDYHKAHSMVLQSQAAMTREMIATALQPHNRNEVIGVGGDGAGGISPSEPIAYAYPKGGGVDSYGITVAESHASAAMNGATKFTHATPNTAGVVLPTRAQSPSRPQSAQTPRHTQTFPVGAHTSGFYSKFRNAPNKNTIKTPNINSLLREASSYANNQQQHQNNSSPSSPQLRHQTKTSPSLQPNVNSPSFISSESPGQLHLKVNIANSSRTSRPQSASGPSAGQIRGASFAISSDATTSSTAPPANDAGLEDKFNLNGSFGSGNKANIRNSLRRSSFAVGAVSTPSPTQTNPWLPPPEIGRIGTFLARLTDNDTTQERISDALTGLVRLIREPTSPSTSLIMFKEGALKILIDLAQRTTSWPQVQANICILVNCIYMENPAMSKDVIIKLGGLPVLLKSGEVASRAYMDARTRAERRGEMQRRPSIDQSQTRRQSVGHSGNGHVGSNLTSSMGSGHFRQSMVSQSTTNFQEEGTMPTLHISSCSNSNSVISSVSNIPNGRNRESIADEGELVRIVPMNHESVVGSLLRRYYEPQFTDQLERQDKAARLETFKTLLSVIGRIDRLLDINFLITVDLDFESALNKIIEDAMQMVNAELVMLYIVDQDTGDLIAYESSVDGMGARERELVGMVRFPAGHGIAGQASLSGDLINVRDPLNYPKYHDEIDYRGGSGQAYSIICVPISATDGTVLGVLEIVNKIGADGVQFFDLEDEFMLKTLGMTAGTIMGNAKVYETMQNTKKKVEVLLETTCSLGSILDIDVLIKNIMDSAKELLSADRCTLFLDDSERKQLRAIIQGRDSVQEIRIPRNAGIAGAVFMSGSPINIPDAYKDSRFNPEVDKQTGYVTRNILCMPIKNIHGESIGVTQMINKKSGAFTPEDESILNSFSAQAAVAIEKSQLFKKTEDMRIYLQSILSSITSCVITLNESMRMHTVNRPWFNNALGVTEEYMQENPCDKWIGPENIHMLNDIKQVYADGQPIYSAEYEVKGTGASVIVNYQIMPLIGSKGVVLVLDDISAEKRAVMTLGRYMSPALAKQVMEDNGQLGGKRKKVSILFSDIRSFTTLSEGMEPSDVVEMLNHHFTDAVNAITDEQGILDKFIGDAVMAVYGVPFASPEDAVHACNTALRMRECLAISNKERAAAGKQVMKIGIGINTGIVLSGNIGSTKRMEFSCIGDAVNLASRTEGLTKYYGTMILVTEYTLAETGDAFITREIEPVVVTGKKAIVRMYELLGRKSDQLPADTIEAIRLYSEAYDMYRRRMFSQAANVFKMAIAATGDGPSKALLARCEQYMQEPPPMDWTGVHISEGK